MTANELRTKLNNEYGRNKEWSVWLEVDADTYANCCQAAFKWHIDNHLYRLRPGVGYELDISVGLNGGLMFKNIELRLK